MPCIGLLEQDLANNAEGFAVALGVVKNLDTSAYTVNQVVYVASAGGLVGTRPTAATDLVQNIGRVIRVHAATGQILVMGPGRTNAVPNYTANRLLGRGSSGGSGDAQEITLGTNLSLSGTTLNATAATASGPLTSSGYTMNYGNVIGRSSASSGAVEELSVGKGLEVTAGGIRVKPLDIGTVELTNSSVSYAKMQNVSATDKLLGRSSAGSGVVEEITCTAAGRALLDDADAASQRVTLNASQQKGQQFTEWFDDLWAVGQWNQSVSGTGAARTTGTAWSSAENAYGVMLLSTGTTATGYASNYDGDEGMWLANGASWQLEIRICPEVLSTAAQEYVLFAGFCDNNANVNEANDGAYFKYERAVTGDFWVCVTANNGTRTSTTTAVAPVALVLQVLRINVNTAGTSVEFRIDGTLVATHTNNIPTTRSTGIGEKIKKTVGTTARNAYIDYIWIQGTRTTDR